ncbi:MAG: DUF721 domain-containing protein [Actinomycetota bacterium]
MAERDVNRLRDLLGDVGRRFGLSGAVETGVVWRRWPEIVGDAIAEHAEPTSLRDGVLRVRTDSPAWAQELTYLARRVVSRANEVAGKPVVSEMKVWVGPGKIPGRVGPSSPHRHPAACLPTTPRRRRSKPHARRG